MWLPWNIKVTGVTVYYTNGRERKVTSRVLTLLLVVVMHDEASKECKRRMGEAYALNKKMNGEIGDGRPEGFEEKA